MGNPGFFLQQKMMDLGLTGQEFTLLEKCGTKALQRAVKVKGRNSGLKKKLSRNCLAGLGNIKFGYKSC